MTHCIFPHSLHFSSIYQLMLLMKTDKDRLGKKLENAMKLLWEIRSAQPKPEGIFLKERVL